MEKDKGCMCLDCACLGSCMTASCAITSCPAYTKAKITVAEAANLLGCRTDVFVRLKNSEDGRKYIVSKLKNLGYNVMIDGQGREARIWRREDVNTAIIKNRTKSVAITSPRTEGCW